MKDTVDGHTIHVVLLVGLMVPQGLTTASPRIPCSTHFGYNSALARGVTLHNRSDGKSKVETTSLLFLLASATDDMLDGAVTLAPTPPFQS